MKPVLGLPENERVRLCAWAERGYPREACGFLLGRRHAARVHVDAVTEARNITVEQAGERYEVAPEDFLAADDLAEASGLEVVGVWHSHPDQSAEPSETDRSNAWAAWSYIILSVRNGAVSELRSWRLAGEHFDEELIRQC